MCSSCHCLLQYPLACATNGLHPKRSQYLLLQCLEGRNSLYCRAVGHSLDWCGVDILTDWGRVKGYIDRSGSHGSKKSGKFCCQYVHFPKFQTSFLSRLMRQRKRNDARILSYTLPTCLVMLAELLPSFLESHIHVVPATTIAPLLISQSLEKSLPLADHSAGLDLLGRHYNFSIH